MKEANTNFLNQSSRSVMRTRNNILAIICLSLLALTACQRAGSTPSEQRKASKRVDATNASGSRSNSSEYGQPVEIARLEDRAVKESSGIVASRRNPDLFWTHNDSGDGPILYAFDRQGASRGRWRVTNAQAYDWEDIAAGPGPIAGQTYLYIGDTGDNDRERDYVVVYRVAEPEVSGTKASSSGIAQYTTEPADAIRFRYPDGKHDSEALLVHPATGDLYVVTKSLDTIAGVYVLKAPYSTTTLNTLKHVDDIGVRGLLGGVITGGDISLDGRRVVLCDYIGAGEFVLPEDFSGKFDEIWKQPIVSVDIGQRKHGEAVCYSLDGRAILATSEKRPTPLIEVKRR